MSESAPEYDREPPPDNPYVRNPQTSFRAIDSLSDSEAETEVENLRAAIEYHDYRYYVLNDPVVSDRVYDALYDRLESLEEAFGLDDPNSPTSRVGAEPLDELETVEHVTPLLSLDSSEEEQEVREFAERVHRHVGSQRFAVEPKLDGFSVEVVYTAGSFDRAVTRGDGTAGEDVSSNVRTIPTVPLELQDAPVELVLRGEVYMPRSAFAALNERRIQAGDDPFANPRNAAAGTVRLLDPATVADRPLHIFFFDVLETTVTLNSQADAFALLQDLGLRVNPMNRIVDDIDQVIAYREEMLDRRTDLDYEIDGIVCKVNDFEARRQLGATSAHPRWAFAYKFPPHTEESTVQRITVQVGRTGKLTPVALIDPVDVGGVTVSRASLHNEDEAQSLGVGVGARVRVERAGEVIPQVAEVLEETADRFEMPSSCPVCDGDVVKEGPIHYCTNGMSCPAQLKRSLEHFGSRAALDIEGLGEEVADLLVSEALVETSVADLYDLTVDDLASLDGWGATSARNLVDEIEASKDCDLASFIHGLGIRHVGKERARALAAAFPLSKLREAEAQELLSVEDIGEEVAVSIRKFFENPDNQRTVTRLLEAGVSPKRIETGSELEGLTIVFTGSIPGYTRDDLVDRLERAGASVTSSVSSATDYLIVGENPGTRKREQAAANDVETLDIESFRTEILDRLDGESWF